MILKWCLLLLTTVAAFENDNVRVDCHPEPNASQERCTQRSCIWSEATDPTAPFCYYPQKSGFKVVRTRPGWAELNTGFPNPFGDNISPLNLTYRSNGNTLLVSIGNDDRYTPPLNLPQTPSSDTAESLQFDITTIPDSEFFAFTVKRKSNEVALWDTRIGGMQFSDKFIQIATYLPSKNLYGFGDHIHKSLKHNLERYTTWSMFATDVGPDSKSDLSTQALYGVHPFYMMVENDGKAHGVLILNSNAQEVTTGTGPHLIYRTIGGRLDLAFFPGPTPEEVVHQYLMHIGKPFLPPYWGLGYHLCRWGFKSLDDMKMVVKRNQDLGIPLDVPIADIDYMDVHKDFSVGKNWTGFGEYSQQLHRDGLHLVLIFDPAIEADYPPFQRGIQQGASFIEWPSDDQVPRKVQDQYPLAKNTRVMLGNVWPDRNTAFPDFLDTSSKTDTWWENEMIMFRGLVEYDGMWIDMNEPSNFDTATYNSLGSVLATDKLACPISGPQSTLDSPPYKTQEIYRDNGRELCTKTLCMYGKTARRTMNFYDTKNLYGWSEARSTYKAIPKTLGKRGTVISRSTFVSSGRYGGHWLGDNTARWEDLQTSVISAMEFNMFGIPYVGSDICGFNGPSNEQLCLRWHQMGAFHSFSRDHNAIDMPAQDPAVWPSVAKAAKIALSFRYYYLPYLYSLHYESSRFGQTVVRPLFFEFPTDSEALEIKEQFLWGQNLMIAPALHKDQEKVHAYFPSAVWYSLQPETYGKKMDVGYNDVAAPLDSLTPVFVRGGAILPRQSPGTTTTASRLNPFELLVASAYNTVSRGVLYYDAGDDLLPGGDIEKHPRHFWSFAYTHSIGGGSLSAACTGCSTTLTPPPLQIIEILGYPAEPNFSDFRVNGNKISLNSGSHYDGIRNIVTISANNIADLAVMARLQRFTITWTDV